MNVDKKSAKRVVYDLMVHLNSQDPEVGKAVWDVIAALRGPDDEDEQAKIATTNRIRGALVTWSGKNIHGPEYAQIAIGESLGVSEFGIVEQEQPHFQKHVKRAVRALEILGITRDGKVRRYKKAEQQEQKVIP